MYFIIYWFFFLTLKPAFTMPSAKSLAKPSGEPFSKRRSVRRTRDGSRATRAITNSRRNRRIELRLRIELNRRIEFIVMNWKYIRKYTKYTKYTYFSKIYKNIQFLLVIIIIPGAHDNNHHHNPCERPDKWFVVIRWTALPQVHIQLYLRMYFCLYTHFV